MKSMSLLVALFAAVGWSAHAGVAEITIGITPNCPYGNAAGCWSGAREALAHLDDVQDVEIQPDLYNCTIHLHLKNESLPDPQKWRRHFLAAVGGAYDFRGVEVTLDDAILEKANGNLVVRVSGIPAPISLVPLSGKLQWNFRKHHTRGLEDEERTAYETLLAQNREGTSAPLTVRVTGPLQMSNQGWQLELREFIITGGPLPH
ncbi:MAG: hypothetical protein WDN28_14880 [Chthoniobacter sp.]